MGGNENLIDLEGGVRMQYHWVAPTAVHGGVINPHRITSTAAGRFDAPTGTVRSVTRLGSSVLASQGLPKTVECHSENVKNATVSSRVIV